MPRPLTSQQFNEILDLLKDGLSTDEVSRKTGVGKSTIDNIRAQCPLWAGLKRKYTGSNA